MLPLYDPVSAANVNTAGAQKVSPEILLLNILIELRVMNDMAWDAQRGAVSQTVAQYRNDVVNDAVNQFI